MLDKDEYKRRVGANICYYRTQKSLNQEDFAELCGYTSNTRKSTISKIEKGLSDVPLSKLKTIADVLDVPISLLTDTSDDSHKKITCELFEQCHDNHAFRLVQYFIELNENGREVLLDYAEDLSNKEKYQKKEAGSSEWKAM